MFRHNEQASPIFEGVTEIWINITLQGINLATWHMWTTKASRVVTFHDDYQRVELGPPYPSVIFHVKASSDSPWVAQTLSQCHLWSTVGCHLTQRSSKLLSLWYPINPVCASTQVNSCCNRAQPTRSLTDTGGGYHLRCSEYENIPLSTFLFGILHFPQLPRPISCKTTNLIANINHIEPLSWEGVLSRVAINHSTSTDNLIY
jgi:hypothetical protein